MCPLTMNRKEKSKESTDLWLFEGNRCRRVGPSQHGGVFGVVDGELNVVSLLPSRWVSARHRPVCRRRPWRLRRIGGPTGRRGAGSCEAALGLERLTCWVNLGGLGLNFGCICYLLGEIYVSERDLGRFIINVLFLWGGKGRAAFGAIHNNCFVFMGRKGMVITHLNYWQAWFVYAFPLR
jgi:hypothetical protein